jgi:phosphoglycolate phosphatase-like HAD superfamily hydrolase
MSRHPVTARRVPLVVWDVDRTLLDVGPSSADAFSQGIRRFCPQADLQVVAGATGSTDRAVVADSLRRAGVPETVLPGTVTSVLGEIERRFEALAPRMLDEGSCLPGVPDVLDRLAELGAVQTVLTGNTRKNALLKLEAFGLRDRLDLSLGAYGDEADDRDDLPPLLWARVVRALRPSPDPASTWIIGDTPRDLRCARRIGVRCLLVASGLYSVDDLAPLGADHLLSDLSDVDGVLRALTAVPTAEEEMRIHGR